MNMLRITLPSISAWRLAALFALLALLVGALMFTPPPPLLEANSPPDTPSHVTVNRSDGSLTASWKAPARSETYHITYSSDGGKSWSLAALNHPRYSITISGVDNSKSYIVGVRARNSSGDSGWRNSYAIGPYNPPKSPPPPKPPARPGVISVSRSDGALHAFWNSVGGATSYHVTYTGDNGVSWQLAALNHPAGNGTTSITISGVENDKPYIVGVRARNSAGDSAWRNSSSVGRYEPPPPPPKPPAAPTGLSAAGSDKSVTLSWNEPTGDVTGYQFQFRKSPPSPGWGKWYTVPDGDRNTTYYTIRGLENGTEYRFKLRAVNSGAVSAPAPTSAPWYVSATPDPNVQPPPPPKPPSAPPAPSSVTATRVSGNIVASWHHSEGATGYDVRYSTDNGSAWKFAAWGWNTSVITIKGASGDKSYIVGVRAVNLVGESAWTNSDTVAALPPTSTAVLTATNISTTGATLNIADHTGAWHYKRTGGPADATCNTVDSGTTATLGSLTANTSYTYTAYGDGSCANALDSVTFSTLLTVSNLDETAHATSCAVGYATPNQQCAVAFTTGSGSGGYTLKSVTGSFDAKLHNPGNIIVKIHSADTTNSSNPGAEVATLSGDDPDTAGQHTFTCSGSDCSLSASTTYFVVMSTGDTNLVVSMNYKWKTTTSDDETVQPTGATGWAIADAGRYKSGSNAWSGLSSSRTGLMKVVVTEKPGLSASSVTATSATLTLSHYSGAWWLKRTTPSDMTCRPKGTTATESLTTLTAGTSYTYKAYSKDGCESGDEIATVTFSTPSS